MAYIIVGGGRVGLRTTRILVEEGYDVTVVENNPEKVHRIEEEGYRVVQGDGSDIDVLETAGITDAEAIAGLTGDLNVNFAACMLGVEYDCRTVLRIDEDYRESIYDKYAEEVDEIIYPEQLGATGAKTALLGGNFNLIADLTEELQLFTVTLTDDSPLIDDHITELERTVEQLDARVYAHGREREPLTIPVPGTTVKPGDHIAVIAERDAVEAVRDTLLGEPATEPAA